LTDAGAAIAEQIARRFAGSGLDAHFASMDQLAEYRAFLQEQGLDCKETFRWTAEGFYAIDLDEAGLELLAGMIPQEARRYLEYGSARGPMIIAVMAPNCTEIVGTD